MRSLTLPKAGPQKTDQDFFIIDAPFPPLLTPSDIKSSRANSNTKSLTEDDSKIIPTSYNGVRIGIGPRWEVQSLASAIKSIEGVLEVGIFCGRTGPEGLEIGTLGGQRPVACYFGMADGTVTVRTARPRLEIGTVG